MMPNGIIRIYYIEVTKIGDDAGSEFPSLVVNVTGTETSVVIGMLEIFTSFEVQVFAVTVSEGEPSDVVVVTTDEDSELLIYLCGYLNIHFHIRCNFFIKCN